MPSHLCDDRRNCTHSACGKLGTDELTGLDQEAKRAQRQAQRWEQIVAHLDAQPNARRTEADENPAALHMAKGEAERMHAEVTRPLTTQVQRDRRSLCTTNYTALGPELSAEPAP